LKRAQLTHGKCLDYVVVCAGFEAAHHVILVTFGCQHQHGHVAATRAQLRAHTQAIQLGQHDVEHD
jgi:hypothetical protein